jgi:hypothetical protein
MVNDEAELLKKQQILHEIKAKTTEIAQQEERMRLQQEAIF